MRKFIKAFVIASGFALFANLAMAVDFYPISSVEVTYPEGSGAFWPESNLIQGPGVGFDEEEPHDKLGGGADHNWVTNADAGFPADYIEDVGMPVIVLDLGADRALNEISMWGYEDTNTNGWREFELRFASAADGAAGFGNTISYNPTFITEDFFEYLAIERQSFPFTETVNARYVELTLTDNYFDDPGDGSGDEGWGPGGDRVGVGEIAFMSPGPVEPPPPPTPDTLFYDIAGITASTEDTDLWPAANLIQGPGKGFDANLPHDRTASGETGSWVTEACGFPCDYLESFDAPELIIDLGEDVALNEIDVWGYASTNSNGVREFELSFATEADGANGFGNSIAYNPTFEDVDIDPTIRQQYPFDETVTARYVKFTATDNYFEEPGDGSEGEIPGGDRIGFSEVAFPLPGQGGVVGDFNGDGMLGIDDINMLTAESAGGMNPPAFDLNSDAAVDAADVAVWINDLKNSYVGDANLDGEFNSGDLVTIFTAAKFETGQPATWNEGDFNGDGAFDSGDFVVAFQGAGYEQGPRPAAAVPEPATGVLALITMSLYGMIRRRK
ncbi:MAG: hypothetical protein KDB27_14215 [Planctomycetales bacterium]|nr:hypothetical protein [Planctomycetales bacterium]